MNVFQDKSLNKENQDPAAVGAASLSSTTSSAEDEIANLEASGTLLTPAMKQQIMNKWQTKMNANPYRR